jgi:hypothetical protein
VITWMTHKSFSRTAEDLDNPRLKLQMKQTCTMFDILTGLKPDHSKAQHPAVRMWSSYEYALGIYGMMLGMEWSFRRGIAEADEFWYLSRGIKETKRFDKEFIYEPPPWMRDTAVLQSHRSNLIRRDEITYGDKWKNVPRDMPYIWPVVDKAGKYTLYLSRSDRERVRTGERVLSERYAERIVNL